MRAELLHVLTRASELMCTSQDHKTPENNELNGLLSVALQISHVQRAIQLIGDSVSLASSLSRMLAVSRSWLFISRRAG